VGYAGVPILQTTPTGLPQLFADTFQPRRGFNGRIILKWIYGE
jgi:hypothetical protein